MTKPSNPPLICHFTPLDTWFFRESRPHGSIGSSELGSVFPPPVRTLLGALRTLIGDTWHQREGTNWRQLEQLPALQAIIGYGDDLGSLRVTGPFVTFHGQRLYPAPANLMVKDGHYFLLDLGKDPVRCDLGKVHLPCFPTQVEGLKELAGSKPADKRWLTHAGLQAVLNGQPPKTGDVVESKKLFREEPRLGIGRDNRRNAVQEGLLYQTRHLRFADKVGIELELHGLADTSLLPDGHIIRLGGEGRQAALSVQTPAQASLPVGTLPKNARTFALYNLTPQACSEGLPAGIPAGFTRTKHDRADVWEGELAGLPLRILSVACGRPIREGGWDMATHQARPVQSLLAPGSVLYAQLQPHATDATHATATLAQWAQQLACQLTDASGRGLFVVGALPVSTQFPIQG